MGAATNDDINIGNFLAILSLDMPACESDDDFIATLAQNSGVVLAASTSSVIRHLEFAIYKERHRGKMPTMPTLTPLITISV